MAAVPSSSLGITSIGGVGLGFVDGFDGTSVSSLGAEGVSIALVSFAILFLFSFRFDSSIFKYYTWKESRQILDFTWCCANEIACFVLRQWGMPVFLVEFVFFSVLPSFQPLVFFFNSKCAFAFLLLRFLVRLADRGAYLCYAWWLG